MQGGGAMIPVTQFLRPNGRKQEIVSPQRSDEIEKLGAECISWGGRFTAEELQGGMISFACEYGDFDIAIELCRNETGVTSTAFDKMVRDAHKRITIAKEEENEDMANYKERKKRNFLAFQQGAIDRKNGVVVGDNPHELNDPEFGWWFKGWAEGVAPVTNSTEGGA